MWTTVRLNGDRCVRCVMTIVAALALGLSLAACTKCDIPTWHPNSPPGQQSCHEGPAW
jgi:hypothetical protein